MKSVNWQNGQRIIKQVLDWFSTSKDENDKELRQDYTGHGVVLDLLNEMDIIAGTNNTPATPSITVRTGVAYDNVGERIIIDNETLSYDATNPSDTTDNGLGVFVPTPHSTGSLNVPLTINSMNYIWIDYLAVIDESVFTLQKATNGKQFYKQTSGYNLTVTTVNTPPTAASLALGTVDLTGFGVVSGSTISTATRPISLIRENRIKIKTPLANLSDATTVYGYNEEHTLDEHIKAVGTGTITPTNPHGTSPDDIGIDVETIISTHQKFMHNNGIIGDETSITSSLYLEFHPISPGDDFIVIKALTSSEVANVDGITVTSSDIPADITFLFSSGGDLSGTYYVYLDKFTQTVVRTTVDPSGDNTKLPLWSMVWTQGVAALFDGNLTAITDLRIFGTINNDKIDKSDTYEFFKVRTEDGSVTSPALSWQSDIDTGMYHNSADNIGFTANGQEIFRYSFGVPGGIELRNGNVLYNTAGTVGVPAYTFATDADTGIYNSADGVLSFTSNGVLSANISGGQITAVFGSAGAPAYSFLTDTDTGIYHPATNQVGIASNGALAILTDPSAVDFYTGGVLRWQIDATALNASGSSKIINSTGTVGSPSYTFTGDTTTGIYETAVGNLAIGASGVIAANFSSTQSNIYTSGISRVQVDTSNITTALAQLNISGSSALPSYSFTGDPNTGMFRNGTDELGFSTNGSMRLHITTSAINASLQHRTTDGSASSPAYAFSSFGNTGMFLNTTGIGEIRFSIQSQEYFKVTGNSVQTTIIPFRAGTDGTAGVPTYSWVDDTNMGMYRAGTDTLAFSTSGNEAFKIDSARKWYYQTQQALIPVQVVQDTLVGQFTTSSSSFVDTGLNVSITPKFISSKILVIASGNSTMEGGDTHYITLYRDGVNLAPNNDGMFHSRQVNNYHCTFQWYDSPSTTLATSYSVRIRTNGATGFCRWGPDPGSTNGISTITVIEYAQ